MTYFLDNLMFPREAMLEAFSAEYLTINNQYGFTCTADSCGNCPLPEHNSAFCGYAFYQTELRKQIATIVKAEHPEVFI